MERLLSAKRVANMHVDLSQIGGEDSPPPRGAFWLLDRDALASFDNVKVEDVPNILGELFLYGKETDRDARVEFVTHKDDDLDKRVNALSDLLGDHGGDLLTEEATGEVPAVSTQLGWKWHLTPEMPVEIRRDLMSQKRQHMSLHVWPEVAHSKLDGKTPSEASADPAYRVRVLGTILLLEMESEQSDSSLDFNQLRAKLGLPLCEDLAVDNTNVSLCRLHLLPAEKMSDEDLTNAYLSAVAHMAVRAIRRMGAEMLKRPGILEKVSVSSLYESLIGAARNVDEALELIAKARGVEEEAGRSPAKWLLQELRLRLMIGDSERCQEIVGTLRTRHLQEPGVAEAVYSLLAQAGVIQPPGQAAGPPDAMPGADPTSVVSGEAPDAGGGKIWTPGSDEGEGEKKTIWTPGMD
jgi:hypothetical protein